MFTISNKADEQTFISLRGLVKNNGFFKSEAQRKFMLKSYGKEQMDTKMLGYLGITLKESDVTYVTIDGYYQWADYGSRSIVPVIITFVIDEFGVRAQYKTGGSGNLRDGWSPDASKCKLMWERDESIEKPSFEVQKPEVVESKSQWIGEVGKRLVVKGKIVFTKLIGYSEWGGKYITIVEDDAGNQIKAWKYLGEKDETVEIKGTVKEHDVHEGVKGTVLTRISILSAETV